MFFDVLVIFIRTGANQSLPEARQSLMVKVWQSLVEADQSIDDQSLLGQHMDRVYTWKATKQINSIGG